MRLVHLTTLILNINALIDSGKYNSISLSDVKNAMNEERLLRFLMERCGKDIDLSLHIQQNGVSEFERAYEKRMASCCNAYAGNEMRKWGIEKLGLCLVLAWTNEIIQQREGVRFEP